jgi:CBS domain-containing protein
MVQHSTSAVAVVDADGKLCGILSLTDLARASLRPQTAGTAERAMSSNVATAIPDIPIAAATQILLDRNVHQLIIQESPTSKRPVGILSMEDIVRDMARSATTKGDV